MQIFDELASDLAGTIFLYISLAISVILICCFIVFIILKKPINELDRWAVTLNKLIIASSIFVYIFEVIIFNILWHFKTKVIAIFSSKGEREYLAACIVGFFGILFIVVLNSRVRMMGLFNIVFIFLIDKDDLSFSIAASFVGGIIALYVIKTD